GTPSTLPTTLEKSGFPAPPDPPLVPGTVSAWPLTFEKSAFFSPPALLPASDSEFGSLGFCGLAMENSCARVNRGASVPRVLLRKHRAAVSGAEDYCRSSRRRSGGGRPWV